MGCKGWAFHGSARDPIMAKVRSRGYMSMNDDLAGVQFDEHPLIQAGLQLTVQGGVDTPPCPHLYPQGFPKNVIEIGGGVHQCQVS
eukprot:761294-Hanusia_phi.AAC.1